MDPFMTYSVNLLCCRRTKTIKCNILRIIWNCTNSSVSTASLSDSVLLEYEILQFWRKYCFCLHGRLPNTCHHISEFLNFRPAARTSNLIATKIQYIAYCKQTFYYESCFPYSMNNLNYLRLSLLFYLILFG